MARRAPNGVPRPRHEREVCVVVDENKAARRPGATPAWVLLCAMVVGAALYAVGGLVVRLWGRG